ncbi:MAG: asparagine synthase-related protein [Candidatus Bathyarchaeia archaeon]
MEALKINVLPFISKRGTCGVRELSRLIAVFDKRGYEAVTAAFKMMETLNYGRTDAFIMATIKSIETAETLHQLKQFIHESPIAIGQVFNRVLDKDRPLSSIIKNVAAIIDGRTYPPIENIREDDPLKIAEELIRMYDGAYAFVMAGKDLMIFGRDSVGLHPLYYGGNSRFFAVASELKALWRLGIKNYKSLPPGNLAIFNRETLDLKPVKTLKEWEVKYRPIEEAIRELESLLEQSISERVGSLDRAALAFSGGLDSSLIALLLKRACVKVELIHVSLEGIKGASQAEEIARKLDMPVHMRLYNEEDIKRELPLILWIIEQPDPLKVSVGIPIHWVAETAASLGYRVLFAGQGADELFGGYKRYVNIYSSLGREEAIKAMVADVLQMHETNLERDYKICCYSGVELRLPFMDYELANFALKLPIELKLDPKGDRKILLRKAAEKLGAPQQIVNMPKQAIQYSTGVNKALIKLAKSHKLGLKDYLKKIFDDMILENFSRYNGEA